MKLKDMKPEEIKIWDEWIKTKKEINEYKVIKDLRSKPYGTRRKTKSKKRGKGK